MGAEQGTVTGWVESGHAGPIWRVGGIPFGFAVALLVGVAVLVVLLAWWRAAPEEVLVPSAEPSGAAGFPATRAATVPGTGGASAPSLGALPSVATEPPVPVVVHVDGAVASPGLVTLAPGTRVADAVLAAGGALADADTSQVNLARLIVDGELVVIPLEGETVAVGPGSSTGTGTTGTGGGPGAAPGPVNLNTADAAALDTLPGIGPVLAERIVTWRRESGPFTAVEDLTSVSGIGPVVLADIQDLVTV